MRDWDGDIIPINRTLSFGCKNGRRFEEDLDRRTVSATCVGGTDWIEPDDWGRCVESKEVASGNYKVKAKCTFLMLIYKKTSGKPQEIIAWLNIVCGFNAKASLLA